MGHNCRAGRFRHDVSALVACGQICLTSWYCIRVRHAKEAKAARLIRDRTGLEVFQPQEHRLRRIRRPFRRQIKIARPLLPRMVFVGFTDAPMWQQIETLRPDIVTGIVVDFGTGEPYRFSQPAIDWARSHDMGDIGDNPAHDPVKIGPVFRIGQLVTVNGPAFNGTQFTIAEIGKKSGAIFAKMANFDDRFEFPLELLEAAQ